MRALLALLLPIALVACDAVAPAADVPSATPDAEPAVDAKDHRGGPAPSSARTFHLWGGHPQMDIQFELAPGAGQRDDFTIRTFDRLGATVGVYEYAEVTATEINGENAPYALSASGPVTEAWDIEVCPFTSMLVDYPQPGDPRCVATSSASGASASQFLGYTTSPGRSIHRLRDGTVHIDYKSGGGNGVTYFFPDATKSSGFRTESGVQYLMLRPVAALGEHDVRSIEIDWPSSSVFTLDCYVVHDGSHTGCGGDRGYTPPPEVDDDGP